MATILYASSPTIEAITRQIQAFFYNPNIALELSKENEWNIIGKNGAIPGVRVILRNKRYRFEKI